MPRQSNVRVGRSFLVGLAVLVTGVIAGCAGDGSDIGQDNPHAVEFKQAVSEATSDFERDVLSDGVITQAEYEEAWQLFATCMEDANVGFKASTDVAGEHTFSTSGTQESGEAAIDACSKGTTGIIEPLFFAVRANPNNDDIDQLVADCLVRHGIADAGYTGDDLNEDMEAGGTDSLEQLVIDGTALGDKAEEFNACLSRPTS